MITDAEAREIVEEAGMEWAGVQRFYKDDLGKDLILFNYPKTKDTLNVERRIFNRVTLLAKISEYERENL